GAVAAAVAAYQIQVRQRLHQAEIDRTAAKVKGAEQRKRRHVNRALAVVLVLLVLAFGGVAGWFVQDHANQTQRQEQLERDLNANLTEAEGQRRDLHNRLADAIEASRLLSDINAWQLSVEHTRELWQ